ncbi:MAG: DUF5362 family protein [Bacteroidota bacterium]|nr:DUF5362 family protein [Bacteroidota bacterium]
MEISNYEFNAGQNESIKKLTHQMMFVGIFLIVLGVLFAVFGVFHLVKENNDFLKFIFDIVIAVVLIIMGLVTINSAKSFKLVVTTEGNDIENLMSALDKMNTWFSIQTMMIVIGILILALGFLNAIGVF